MFWQKIYFTNLFKFIENLENFFYNIKVKINKIIKIIKKKYITEFLKRSIN